MVLSPTPPKNPGMDFCKASPKLSYKKNPRTFLLLHNAIPNTSDTIAKLSLSGAQLGEGVGKVGELLRQLVFNLCELGRGNGREINLMREGGDY